MCFSEKQSYINALLLFCCGIYKLKQWRLGIPLIFLGLKDLLQGFLYKSINNQTLGLYQELLPIIEFISPEYLW